MSRGLSVRPGQTVVPKSARLAVAVVFFVGGAGIANWVARIPEIQQKLALSNSSLGVALLGTAAGSLLSMPITGWLLAHVGSRLVTKLTALGYCIALPLPTLAPNLPLLTTALMVLGAFFGALDVAMNAQAVDVEQRYHRPIMSSFHGLYSVGGMAGAASGGLLASLGVNPQRHLLATALLLGMVVALASRRLLPVQALRRIDTVETSSITDRIPHSVSNENHDHSVTTEPTFALPTRSLFNLGILAFCVLLSEGAIADWSAVYLRQTLKTGPGLAAAGYAVFSLAMAVCRLTGGDRLTQRLGPVLMVRLGGTVAATGMGLSLVVTQPLAVLIGFACVAVGLSSLVPIVFSAAGRTPGIAPGLALAAVTTAGYSGLLCGPSLIGVAADVFNLRVALGIVVVMTAMSAVLAPTVARAGND